jgi:hypothetical protein
MSLDRMRGLPEIITVPHYTGDDKTLFVAQGGGTWGSSGYQTIHTVGAGEILIITDLFLSLINFADARTEARIGVKVGGAIIYPIRLYSNVLAASSAGITRGDNQASHSLVTPLLLQEGDELAIWVYDDRVVTGYAFIGYTIDA